MNHSDEEIRQINSAFEEAAFEMANFSNKVSGLGADIWLDSAGKNRKVEHNSPRVKIALSDGTNISVAIAKPSKTLAKPQNIKTSDLVKLESIKPFVESNVDVLLKHWNSELEDDEALLALRIRRKNPALSLEKVLELVAEKLKD